VNAAPARLLVPGVFALAGFAVLIGLGTWQVERKARKEALIATLTQRLNAPPQPLPLPQNWAQLDRSEAEFRRVAFRADFLADMREARLFTSGSALRDDVQEPGYFVFAPARLTDGRKVMVNRGFASAVRPTPATPPVAVPQLPVDVIGVMRWPGQPGWFDHTYSPTDDLWFVADHVGMAAQNQWGEVAPFYVEMEAPVPSGGVPRPGRLRINLPNDHLQYAITWYGLAAVLAVVFLLWARSRRRQAEG
jgi:surfeit locus 1 family protein